MTIFIFFPIHPSFQSILRNLCTWYNITKQPINWITIKYDLMNDCCIIQNIIQIWLKNVAWSNHDFHLQYIMHEETHKQLQYLILIYFSNFKKHGMLLTDVFNLYAWTDTTENCTDLVKDVIFYTLTGSFYILLRLKLNMYYFSTWKY
jgi:hypothetical protein